MNIKQGLQSLIVISVIVFTGILSLSTQNTSAQAPCSFLLDNRCSDNSSVNVGDQLLVTIADAGNGEISVTWENLNGTGQPSTIAQLYVDDGACFDGVLDVISGPATNFADPPGGSGPNNLPSQNTCNPLFSTEGSLTVKRESGMGGISNGIDPGEQVEVIYDAAAGVTAGSICDEITQQGMCPCNFGVHVQRLPPDEGQSDAYANCTSCTAPKFM